MKWRYPNIAAKQICSSYPLIVCQGVTITSWHYMIQQRVVLHKQIIYVFVPVGGLLMPFVCFRSVPLHSEEKHVEKFDGLSVSCNQGQFHMLTLGKLQSFLSSTRPSDSLVTKNPQLTPRVLGWISNNPSFLKRQQHVQQNQELQTWDMVEPKAEFLTPTVLPPFIYGSLDMSDKSRQKPTNPK